MIEWPSLSSLTKNGLNTQRCH